jgi:hypothetical protein
VLELWCKFQVCLGELPCIFFARLFHKVSKCAPVILLSPERCRAGLEDVVFGCKGFWGKSGA